MPIVEGILLAAKEAVAVTAEAAKEGVEVAAEAAKEAAITAKETVEETGKKVSEMIPEQLENFKKTGEAVGLKMDIIRNMMPEQLMERLNDNCDELETSDFVKDGENLDNKERLIDSEKAKIKEETDWSDEIINSIGSIQEYEIYKNIGLEDTEINGRKCLIRNDIDWNQKDQMGRTNKERMEQGLAPIHKEGTVIELHHIGQHNDSPLAELSHKEHQSDGNYLILHDSKKESEIDRSAFDKERINHWKDRANEGSNS